MRLSAALWTPASAFSTTTKIVPNTIMKIFEFSPDPNHDIAKMTIAMAGINRKNCT